MAAPNKRELANKEILKELQHTKQQLLKHGATPITSSPLSIPALPGNIPSSGLEHFSSIPRGAVIQAQASAGFFVPTDSVYGNAILPVLPRFDTK